MRPFTLGRLADLIRLVQTMHGVTVDQVEEAMMVTEDRALELLKQAEEMGLVKCDGALYYSTSLGNIFFEAFIRGDKSKLDGVLNEYAPYFKIKSAISRKSTDVEELKRLTGLTEVAIEIVLRLLQYTCDNLCFMDERIFLSTKELPKSADFFSVLKNAYLEFSKFAQWGCSKNFIRVDKVAIHVCQELRLSLDDFSKMLSKILDSDYPIDLYSEGMSYQFMPFVNRKINPSSYRKCYIRIRT